ncbi:hypothetical protein FRB95_005567 [Tulasnella sp. JGI-2019a]|nr:hypothetical protein FRB95_005567 [Tulasnella sp. JGI-2019a]
MPPKRSKNQKKKKIKKATAAIGGQDDRSSGGESHVGGDQQVNLAVDDEPGPVNWQSDIELTDSLVSYLHDNQELRQVIIPHGDLCKVDEGNHSKDKSFFKLAQHLFGGNPKYEELAKGIDLAESESDIREYAELVEERWRQLVGMTGIAGGTVGDDLKGIKDEKDIEAMDGGEVGGKVENIKATHPWYFKIRSFFPRERSSSTDPTDAPVQGTTAAFTEEHTTEPQDEPSSKTPIDESEPAATTLFNDIASALSGTPQVVATENPNNRATETIASPLPTSQQIDSPEKTIREELGVQDHLCQDTTQKEESGGEREGANTQSVADVTRALEEEMVVPAPIIAITVPLSGEVTNLAAPQAEGLVSSSVDCEQEHRGRSEQPTPPTLGRLTSSPRSTASVNRVQVVVESPITVEVDELIMAGTLRTMPPVPIISIGPSTASAGRGSESCAVERQNRCSIYDVYETWDAIRASGETETPTIHSNPTHEPITVSVDQVESQVPIVPDESNTRLEQAIEVSQSYPDSPVPGNLKAVVLAVASTTQAGPLVSMPSIDFEALDRAPGEQPSYSIENGIVLAGPSGSVNHGRGYTGTPVLEEKNSDEQYALSAPWTSEAHKTPHAGSGFDTASKHDATPPGKEMVELGVTPVLERIEGVQRAASPVCVPTSERTLRVLSFGAPRQRPIEVTPKSTVEEYARHPRNRDPASHSPMTTSQTNIPSAMECMASTASVPFVSESSATGAKQAGAPLPINLLGAPHRTVRATDQKPALGRPLIVYQEKDFFKRTIRSSVQPQAPRSQVAPPPIPAPRPNDLLYATTPAFPPGPAPELSTAVASGLQAAEPTGSTMFPTEETPVIISVHDTVPTPMAVFGASSPRPTKNNLDSLPGGVSLSSNDLELLIIPSLASSGGRTRPYPESRSVVSILADVAVLDVAAHAVNEPNESDEDESKRRRESAQQRYPHSSGMAAGAGVQSRGGYHPFVSMTDAAVYLPQARPSVTFQFPNQPDGPGSTEGKGVEGGTGPVSASPALCPVSVVLSPSPRSNSFGSESTMRQIQSPMDRYDQDRRDRERTRGWGQERAEERYGFTRRGQWDDDRSVPTTRVRYVSPSQSNDRGNSTTQHRYASPARSDNVECVCSSCRNIWMWRTVEYCGLVLVFIFYLAFMARLLFQDQGIRLIRP